MIWRLNFSQLAKNEDLQEEKVRLYRAMCSSDHEESIQKCLELGLKVGMQTDN